VNPDLDPLESFAKREQGPRRRANKDADGRDCGNRQGCVFRRMNSVKWSIKPEKSLPNREMQKPDFVGIRRQRIIRKLRGKRWMSNNSP
jgi:hypothetical protein